MLLCDHPAETMDQIQEVGRGKTFSVLCLPQSGQVDHPHTAVCGVGIVRLKMDGYHRFPAGFCRLIRQNGYHPFRSAMGEGGHHK